MKPPKTLLITLAAIFTLSPLALALPAAALANGSSTSPDTNVNPIYQPIEPVDNSQPQVNDLNNKFKLQAQAALQQARTDAKQQTELQRQQVCQARQTAIANRMANAVKLAKAHKALFDDIYAKLKQFYVNKQLSVSDYSSLINAADTAQANAAASLSSLQSLDVTINCGSSTVAETVSTFQQALKSTRDNLLSYRTALVDLVKALKTAFQASGGSQ